MATYGYSEPAIFESEAQTSPIVQAYFATAGHTTLVTQIHRADFVVLAAGTLGRCATSATMISGLAIHDETAVWSSATTGAGAPPGGGGIGNLFGATQVSSATAQNLLPAEPGQVHVNKLTGGQLVEASLINTTAWATTLIGAAVGIRLDAASNLFIVDPAATQCANIVNVVVKGTQGLLGDFGVRVLINFLPADVN
jgi:hypothetical protein